MSDFLDTAKLDLAIFFNEISEKVYLDGSSINIIIDYDRLKDRSKKEYDGIYIGDLLYFAKVEDFISPPIIGGLQIFNKKKYEVFDVRKDVGLYEIILKGSGS